MMGHANPILRLCNALASRGHEVVFLTSSALGPKLGVLCSNSGCRFQGLEDGLTEEALKTPDAGKNPRFEEFCQRHTPLLTAALESIRPALILSDFASGAGFASARAKRIPLVINMAIPATAVQAFMMLQNSAMLFLGKRIKPGDAETLDSWSAQRCPFPLCCFKRTLAIVNDCSALGAREPLPPNFFLSGSLDSFETKPLQESKHADILAWLRKARAAAKLGLKPIFYITTGSLLDLTDKQVLALYHGFAACDVWVMWSLKK
ncbi:UFGT, partial [Symbiodinium natans]